MNSLTEHQPPNQSQQIRTHQNPLAQLLLGVALIAAGVLVFLWGSGRAIWSAGKVQEQERLAPVALAQEASADAPAAVILTDGEPVVEEQVEPDAEQPMETAGEQHALQDSYCLWPGDTLSDIAYFSNVDESFIQTINPEFTGYAGAAVLLPEGSTPPAQWPSPLPVVKSIAELPFGISGYYISYDNRQKRVALSFDIGYVPRNHELMATLAQRGIRATYFMLGEAVQRHPEIIPHILDNGHELGNHSFTHENMQGMSEAEIRSELDLTEQAVQAAVPGATTKPLFRAPFGAIDDYMVQIAGDDGYYVIGWTVDSRDWTDGITADAIYERVTHHVCPGAIIAFHDVNPANYLALPRIIDYLEANDYEFVNVSDMIFPH